MRAATTTVFDSFLEIIEGCINPYSAPIDPTNNPIVNGISLGVKKASIMNIGTQIRIKIRKIANAVNDLLRRLFRELDSNDFNFLSSLFPLWAVQRPKADALTAISLRLLSVFARFTYYSRPDNEAFFCSGSPMVCMFSRSQTLRTPVALSSILRMLGRLFDFWYR